MQQVELVEFVHRPRNVDEKYQIRALACCLSIRCRFKAQHEQLRVLIPGAHGALGLHAEQIASRAARHRGIVVVEVVQHFLEAHRSGRNLINRVTRADHPTQVAIRSCINIGRNRGERFALRGNKTDLVNGLVLLGVELFSLIVDECSVVLFFISALVHRRHGFGFCRIVDRRHRFGAQLTTVRFVFR